MIDDTGVDMNKIKVSKEDKNVFSDLNKLIIDINSNKVKKEDAVERLKEQKYIWLGSTKAKTKYCSSI